MFKLSNVSSLALGLALVGGLGLSTAASATSASSVSPTSSFSMSDLAQGYTVAAADQAKEPAEGKCGEGKCGAAIES